MKIRSFIALVCAVTILVIGLGMSRAAKQTLGQESKALERIHSRSVSEFAKAVIEGRIFLLSAFRENLDSGNKVAKEFLLLNGTNHSAEFQKSLESIRRRTKCDVVLVAPFDQRNSSNGLPTAVRDLFPAVRKGKPVISIVEVSNHPTLISVSALKLFDEPVGGVVLGFYLDGEAVGEIQRATGAEVHFVMPNDARASASTLLEVHSGENQIEKVAILVAGGPVLDISRTTESELFRTAVVCFLLSLLALYALLEFGFLRRFKGVLRDITRSSSELSQGRILEVSPRWHPIREVNELSDAFVSHLGELRSFQGRIESKSRTEALGEVTAQVAHDLKGLISTIEMQLDVEHETSFSVEKKLTLKRLFSRVRGITATVVERIRSRSSDDAKESRDLRVGLSDESMSREPAYVLIDCIVAEKSFQYGERPFLEIEMQAAEYCHGLFVSVQPNEFKRILANLIDNAAEAINDSGMICVRLTGDSGRVQIRVTDTGRGIPSEVLPRLFRRGASFGKVNGLGLGLWHAKTVLLEWCGEISISSCPEEGTCVDVVLPRMEAPALFITELSLSADAELVTLDDDQSVGEVWKRCVDEANASGMRLRHVHFCSSSELAEWIRTQGGAGRNRVFLFDYNLSEDATDGLRLLKGVQGERILVTGMSDDLAIRGACEASGIRLLPKALLPFIEILGKKSGGESAVRRRQ